MNPAAWIERTENGHDRLWSYSLETWANRPANPEPLYAQDAIDQLTAERDVLALRLEKLEALLRKPDVGIFEALDHHGPAEGLLEFVEGLWYTPEGSYLHLDDALEALVP